ncbi:hypothetical protein Herbaro_09430 [Herbaspirillum sp. WKF16]|uniref:hypothetical protein n=1 Tax=Herbaspirillum sp. WKF16 TaxID=3028312 RepID=UPI0023A996C1|nr:hypothetical protein [Herbaspirillum sp. WKF16]WDZ97981.1 hypothetical protein Herbaro_09430 [Herbaspirillum sp. WKF16]
MKLITTQPFGDYPIGAQITDPAAITKILAGEQVAFVVKVPDDPAPVDAGDGGKTK